MNNNPVGIFDSGIGGLTILKEAKKTLPYENFVYMSDTKNFPYGEKKAGELKKIVIKNIETLVSDKKCKAVVVACNTATGVAIKELRNKFKVPIIGMEPAIKPALEGKHKKVLVLATPVTLKLEKFNQLRSRLDKKNDLIVLPAKGLAELIEKNILKRKSDKEIKEYLKKLFSGINKNEISTVVLGCTHYVHIKNLIKRFFPGKKVIDGNKGTVSQLKKVLKEEGLLRKEGKRNIIK